MTVPLDIGRDDTYTASRGAGPPMERVALVDLLDRLLAGGVVVSGDLVISIAGVDLVQVSLRALITTIREEILPATLEEEL
ncbi:gas vesicle protein [Spirillospora sp. NPDC029432]|uniref:gas vesicle protein n=1 Tax=Spirillospora sp. NPDC029432 TaxID=3154599 RepID=UPI003453BEDA